MVTAPDCKPINVLPYNEPIDYEVGSSVGSQQKWSNYNSGDEVLVIADNLVYNGLTTTGNAASFSGAGSECFTKFTPITTGTIYASFLMSVSDYASITSDGVQDYFITLTDEIYNNYKAHFFIKKVGEQYQLGLASTGSITTNYAPNLFNVGDVVHVTIGYDFVDNSLKAWLNPILTTFTSTTIPDITVAPTTAISSIAGFVLRQGSDGTTPTIIIDEIKIANSLNELFTTVLNYPIPSGPLVNSNQNFCANTSPTVASLIATGSNIQWYTTATGGSPLSLAASSNSVVMKPLGPRALSL
jgi:hypothetical protein